jgi:hypothetical protein
MLAPVIAVLGLCGIAIGTLVVVRQKNQDNASPRVKAIRSLVMWSVVIVVGLAIWFIAQRQISN